MKKFKKQFLAAAMIVALGAAVYLNWSMTSPASVTKTLGESKFVNATVATETTKPKASEKSTQKPSSTPVKSNLTQKQKDYFAEAKTNRDKTQDKIIDKASETLGMENLSDSDKTEAQSQVAGVIKNFTYQDTIESALRAKGFSQVLAYVNENGCTVTVPGKELKKGRNIMVKSTVQSVAGISFDKITIITV